VTHLHEVEALLGEGAFAADLARAAYDAASRWEASKWFTRLETSWGASAQDWWRLIAVSESS
jgi:hypothetical protein